MGDKTGGEQNSKQIQKGNYSHRVNFVFLNEGAKFDKNYTKPQTNDNICLFVIPKRKVLAVDVSILMN